MNDIAATAEGSIIRGFRFAVQNAATVVKTKGPCRRFHPRVGFLRSAWVPWLRKRRVWRVSAPHEDEVVGLARRRERARDVVLPPEAFLVDRRPECPDDAAEAES